MRCESGVGQQLADGVQPGVDRRDFGERRGEPLGDEPCAERRDGAIEDAEERAFAAAVSDCGHQLQAAARGGVDRQSLAG